MMSKKKNQHYVPKFYLRRFSFESNENEIGVYNIHQKKFIQRAPLKGQAYKPYFYGKDGLVEDNLSALEGLYAEALRSVNEKGIPEKNTIDHNTLLEFIMISLLRNLMINSKIVEQFQKMGDIIYGDDDSYNEDKSKFQIPQEEAVILNLNHLPYGLELIQDMELKLIKNHTQKPFITSDNPVVKYNQFIEAKKHPLQGHTGIASLGLQVLLPIDEKNMLILYDPWVYKVGDKRQLMIDLTNENDIFQINILQFLNCVNNTFFNHNASTDYINQLCQRSINYQRANQVIINKYPSGGSRPNSDLIVSTTTDIRTKMQLSFIKQTSNAKEYILDNRVVFLRRKAEQVRAKHRM